MWKLRDFTFFNMLLMNRKLKNKGFTQQRAECFIAVSFGFLLRKCNLHCISTHFGTHVPCNTKLARWHESFLVRLMDRLHSQRVQGWAAILQRQQAQMWLRPHRSLDRTAGLSRPNAVLERRSEFPQSLRPTAELLPEHVQLWAQERPLRCALNDHSAEGNQ